MDPGGFSLGLKETETYLDLSDEVGELIGPSRLACGFIWIWGGGVCVWGGEGIKIRVFLW